MNERQAESPHTFSVRRRVLLALAFVLLTVGAVTATVHFANEGAADWLVDHRNRIVAAEIAFFGIFAVEAIAALVVRWFHQNGALQTGIALRAVVRVVSYMLLLVSIVSILASNPALAIGVGGVTGVVVAFSAQNLVGNAFAGVFLAVATPFRIGEEITVMGVTGTVTDIRVMHTRLDLGDEIALIPSSAMMSQAIRRKARRGRMDWEDGDY
jgi:small-conductance mechanosensitive channel